ncbi:phage tail tip lysozyme [Candidatus Bathyarchaeota archaeon]|nr:phage tail tip lysozyme [Candidatus Bathyarchaeota archaeon]
MLKNLTNVTVSLLCAVATSAAILPTQSMATSSVQAPFVIVPEGPTHKTEPKEVVPENPKVKRLICKGCNINESQTLEFLQNRGITDKNALATIMGNIRQESTFTPNVCEGGARVSYYACRSGGFGLLQWTDNLRYNGLGRHAASIGASPSSLDAQLDYMLHEGDWKLIEPYMKTPGGSIHYYMRLASRWIRWGHHGARTDYAYNYASKLVSSKV